jgi:hypothetical protein
LNVKEQQRTDRQRAVQTQKLEYYHHRIAELGLSELEAQRAGIWPDPDTGDLLLFARKFDGSWRNIQPKKGSQRPFTIRRTHPDRVGTTYWRTNKETLQPEQATLPKYISEPGQTPVAYPTPSAITAYQRETKGGTITFIEGYFKALALSRAGGESVAFGGLGLYNLNSETRKYLNVRRPDKILIAYDGDYSEVRRDKETGRKTSQRKINFFRSALRFAQQLNDYLASIGHKAKIVWVAVNPDNPAKGADDLLAAAANPAEVVEDLLNLREGANWTFTKLHATTYEARLKQRFTLNSATCFYHEHADEIGLEIFTYSGLDFRMDEGELFMVSDPFDVVVDLIPVSIFTHLSEEKEVLDSLLKRYPRLALQADTGTGKTTFVINWAIRTGQRLVIVVPTRIQCKQLAEDFKKYNALAVYGVAKDGRAEQCLTAQIIVATYDTIHHVPDLADRALVIDEGHNLINQYGQTRGAVKLFRARTLTRLQQLSEAAQQVVYLSGTMPKALLHAYGIRLVDVRRLNSPNVHLRRLTTYKDTPQAHAAALASQLIEDLKTNPHQVHFALFNNTQLLNLLRAQLIEADYLKADEIEVISRTNYNAGETSALDDLVDHSVIRPGIRLVLTTSLIAEGVNIKNTNVGNVYAAGVKCPDTVRQFAARFREMGDVNLFLILPAEREPGAGFRIETVDRIKFLTNQATAAASYATISSEAGMAEDYDRSDIFPHIMPNEAGDGYVVDTLAILATERDRMLATAPTSYTVGRLLSYHGFALATAEQAPIDTAVVADLKTATDNLKRTRDAHLESLRTVLSTAPDNALAALKIYYQRKGNRKQVQHLDALAWELIDTVPDLDALAWLNDHESALEFDEVRELIRRAGQLHFAGVAKTEPWLKITGRNWNKTWQQIKTAYRLDVLKLKPRTLTAGLRLDLMAKDAIGKALDKRLNGNNKTITDQQLAELIRDTIGRTDKRKKIDKAPCLTTITLGRAVQLIEELYLVDITRHGTKRVLLIGERHGKVPTAAGIVGTCLSLKANLLKINDLRPEI